MKNWRTTIFGLLAGLCPIAQTVNNCMQTGQPVDWSKIGMGAFVMVLGYFCKDFSVSGTAK